MKTNRLRNEKELVRLMRQGETRAFQLVYEFYWPILFSHSLRMLQDEDEAEDMVQEVFFSLYKQIHKLDGDSNLGAWLFVSLRNRVLNHFRQQKAKLLHLEKWMVQNELDLACERSPLEGVVSKEIEQLLEREIQQMPPRMREIFELSRKECLSHKEIARRLSLSDKTVKTQVNNALRILRSRFSGGLIALALCVLTGLQLFFL